LRRPRSVLGLVARRVVAGNHHAQTVGIEDPHQLLVDLEQAVLREARQRAAIRAANSSCA
jgi:hypothetical protein